MAQAQSAKPCCAVIGVPPAVVCIAPCDLALKRAVLFKRAFSYKSQLVSVMTETRKDNESWRGRAFEPSIENVELICAVIYDILYRCSLETRSKRELLESSYIVDASYVQSPDESGNSIVDLVVALVPFRKQMMWDYLMRLVTRTKFVNFLKTLLKTTSDSYVYRTIISLVLRM